MTFNPMYSVDDFYYFYLVVKYGGFSAASEATTISKSKLSRHVVDLENKFKIQLIQRTTRYFKVTTIGQELYEQCCKIMSQVEVAENVLTRHLLEPEGLVKIACSPLIAQSHLRILISQFLKTHAKVNVSIELTNRHIDLLNDNVDIVVRNNFDHNDHHDLIIRDLAYTSHCLVAHPDVVNNTQINQPTDLYQLPCIGYGIQNTHYSWRLKNKFTNEQFSFPIQPRITTNDFSGVYYAAKDGLGVADLPYIIVEPDLMSGALVQVLPHWQSNESTLQIAYAQRRGQRFVIEKLVESLIQGFRDYNEHKLDYVI